MSKILCIYHGGCDDGFASAYFVRQALKERKLEAEFYPGSYAFPPPDVTGKDVLLVDFSYKRPVLEEMIKQCRTLTVLDHHKTAQEDLAFLAVSAGRYEAENIIAIPKALALFDMNKCGVGIVWDYFNPGKTRPDFVEYIEDRDLWKKLLPNGDEFTIALRSYPQDFDTWDHIVDDGEAWCVRTLIDEGKAIQRYYRLRVEEFKRHAYPGYLIFGNPDNPSPRCMIANAQYFAASEVAGELAELPGVSFGATYFEVAANKWQYSLRSRGDFDVSAIAKQFGGGGHKNAAGFNISGHVVHQAE